MEHAMRAAVVTDFHAPLQIQDLPVPEPGPGQVLVRIEATGLCHTDIHAAHGDWPVTPTPPFVPGHEGIGRVEKLGDGVTTRSIGDRVAIAWLAYACGECRQCIGGWETLCARQQTSGYSVDGTFAEYTVVAAAFATPVPDAICAVEAAPLTCAGVTTYKAIKVARVAPAETVAIFGIGGLGHLALQYARIAGGFVIGVDIAEDKLAMATELGADHVVNARAGDPVATSTRGRATRWPRSRRSAAPTSQWRWPPRRSRSTRPTDRCGRVAGWCASQCPPTTPRSACRSSTP
jgi:propanol-preferring alcohol dehydrogenase